MSKIKIFTPPHQWDNSTYTIDGILPVNIFLGGTIDNGDSFNHQDALISELKKSETAHPLCIYNPRRSDWPSSEDHDEIDKQIKWELYHLERADLIVMNILGGSKSPISLMEIGLFASQNKLLVFCPKDFYRYDNVRVVCGSYGIPLFETNDVTYIKDRVLDYEKNIQVI
jgi:hypothetical protein